jgi:hypothetical protein
MRLWRGAPDTVKIMNDWRRRHSRAPSCGPDPGTEPGIQGAPSNDYWSLTGLALRSFSTRAKICYGGHGAVISEEAMAKGQIKGNKEAKKPKADKNQSKTHVSAYKASQGKGGQSMAPPAKKS